MDDRRSQGAVTRAENSDVGTTVQDRGSVTRVLDTGITQAPDTGGPDRHTTWLTTIIPDGSPHVTAVGAAWVGGAFWFQTGDGTRKAKNVARVAAVWVAGGWPCEADASGLGLTAPFNAPAVGAGTVVRLPHHASIGDVGLDDRTRWRDALDVLTEYRTIVGRAAR